jgi:hypothetical protein
VYFHDYHNSWTFAADCTDGPVQMVEPTAGTPLALLTIGSGDAVNEGQRRILLQLIGPKRILAYELPPDVLDIEAVGTDLWAITIGPHGIPNLSRLTPA